MKVILDENMPRKLRHYLPGHEVVNVQYMGWQGIGTGDLIRLIDGVFDVLITGDKNLRYQQNLTGRRIAIVQVPGTSWDIISKIVSEILQAVELGSEGSYIIIDLPEEQAEQIPPTSPQ